MQHLTTYLQLDSMPTTNAFCMLHALVWKELYHGNVENITMLWKSSSKCRNMCKQDCLKANWSYWKVWQKKRWRLFLLRWVVCQQKLRITIPLMPRKIWQTCLMNERSCSEPHLRTYLNNMCGVGWGGKVKKAVGVNEYWAQAVRGRVMTLYVWQIRTCL